MWLSSSCDCLHHVTIFIMWLCSSDSQKSATNSRLKYWLCLLLSFLPVQSPRSTRIGCIWSFWGMKIDLHNMQSLYSLEYIFIYTTQCLCSKDVIPTLRVFTKYRNVYLCTYIYIKKKPFFFTMMKSTEWLGHILCRHPSASIIFFSFSRASS